MPRKATIKATEDVQEPQVVVEKKKIVKATTEDVQESQAVVEEKKTVKKEKKAEYIFAVGRRKTAIASVKLYKNGNGEITVNEKPLATRFDAANAEVILAPLHAVGQADKINISVKVLGGGPCSQAEAVRHGISRALVELNPNFRKPLKKAGYLARDSRKKERKKPGLRRARRAPQWSKR